MTAPPILTTPEKIMEVAEKLFALQGFEQVSLRDITSEAEVNLAAVNYHFGSKEGLINAVVTRNVLHVNRRRQEQLRALPPTASASQILAAFLEPLLKGIGGTRQALQFARRLLGRCLQGESGELPAEARTSIQQSLTLFATRLHQLLPGVTIMDLIQRLIFSTSILVQQLAHEEWHLEITDGMPGGGQTPPLDLIISFCTPGLAIESRETIPPEQSPHPQTVS